MEEQARRATGARIEQVLELTTDGVIYLDRSYNFTFLNRRACELLSPSGDLLGANLWNASPDTRAEGSPYVEQYSRSMDHGLVSKFETFYPAPFHMWLSITSVPATDGIILLFRDITEERQDKESLRLKQLETERQHAEIETVYPTAPVGLALFDPVEFRYLRLNNRQSTEHKPAEKASVSPSTISAAACPASPSPHLRAVLYDKGFERTLAGGTSVKLRLSAMLARSSEAASIANVPRLSPPAHASRPAARRCSSTIPQPAPKPPVPRRPITA